MPTKQKIEEYYPPKISLKHKRLFDNFCETFEVKFLHICEPYCYWNKVLNYQPDGGKRSRWSGLIEGQSKPPKDDHGRMIFSKCRVKFYTSQPYSYNDQTLKAEELDKWCEEKKLKYIILDREYSFYNPGNTTLVVYYLPKDEELILERIEKYKEICNIGG